jgi:aryl-alcohol dehydrogenase-like predicted oxidoreductase
MRTRQLGNTDLHLSVVGFGAWAIGGHDWQFGWGPQNDAESVAAIHKALDLGINWIDTAAVYGLGHSEKVVGKAIERRRDKVLVATKCALRWDEKRIIYNSLKPESIVKECEDSLRRLNTDYIDLYQIHWPNPDEEIEDGWQAVSDLIQQGKIRHGGVSNFDVMQMQRCARIAPIASLQPPYHLLRRDVENEILSYCEEHEIGVVAYSPMASGLLTGKYTLDSIKSLPKSDWRSFRNELFQLPQVEKNLAFVDMLKAIAVDQGKTVAQLAIAWVLRRPEVTSAIVGARSAMQVEQIVPAADWELSEDDLEKISSAAAQMR